MFWYDVFEVLRRNPQPEQAVNGEATKVLMRELDCQETYANLRVDTGNLLEQHVMSLINGGGSCVFRMPLIDSDKSLHKLGEGLNEFDLIINQSNSYPDLDNECTTCKVLQSYETAL